MNPDLPMRTNDDFEGDKLPPRGKLLSLEQWNVTFFSIVYPMAFSLFSMFLGD